MPRCYPAATLIALAAASLALAQPASSFSPPAPPTPASPASAPASPASPAAHRPDAAALAARASAYLLTQQDAKTGGWSISTDGPNFPAISALVLTGLFLDPAFDTANPPADPALRRGIEYILSMQKPDGSIYDQLLPSYNTSIALSALARVNTPDAKAAVRKAQAFLKGLQISDATVPFDAAGETAAPVSQNHPFFGGVGYGRHGRPDLSNLAWFLQGLHDSGLPADDPAFQRALVFLQRTQMLATADLLQPDGSTKTVVINDMPYAQGSRQGGFIYATSENRDKIGAGQSFAGNIDETLSDGTVASRLRCYGSMTYSGFKSYLYAGLSKTDPRVTAAHDWIRRNYTVAENPGLGTDGYYYYLVTFARALHAFGASEIQTVTPDGLTAPRRWADDLVARLAELQQPDGSFKSLDDRWMENNPVLITAYALIALREVQAAAHDAAPGDARPAPLQ